MISSLSSDFPTIWTCRRLKWIAPFLAALFLPLLIAGAGYAEPVEKIAIQDGTTPQDSMTMGAAVRLRTLAQDMKYLDEVLTTSVLTYSFTQDEKWLARYNEHLPKLLTILEEALSYKQRSDAVVIARINWANDKLAAMEDKAIELVGSGQGQQALNILNSDDYREQKTQYAQALTVYFLTLEENIQAGLHSTDETVQAKAQLTDEEKNWIKTHTVKVGIEEWAPIVFTAKNGEAGGLAGGYLKLLSESTGLKFEIVSDAWDPLLNGLRERTIDLLPATYFTEERAAYGLYSEPYFLMKEFIYVQSNNTTIKSLDDLAQGRIAVVKGFGTIPKLKEYLPNATIVETADQLASINAVLNGEVDALVEAQMAVQQVVNTNGIVGLKGISQNVFPSSPIHLFSRMDAPLLQSILQKGLDTISEKTRRAEQRKWLDLDEGTKKKVQLTLDEEQWLSNHPNIRVGDDFAWPPFSFRDDQGNMSGISSGYLETLSERLSVDMTPVWGLSWTEVLDKIKTGDLDIIPAIANTPERAEFLNFTKPYISFPVVIATRKDGAFVDSLSDLNGVRVGVVGGYITETLLSTDHPEIKLVPFKNLKEGLSSLQDKDVAAFVDNLGSITHLFDQHKLIELKIAAPTDYRFELSIGVRKDWPELVAILDKALATIDDKERAAIKNAWMAIQVQFGLDITTILKWAVPITLGGLSIIIFVVVWNRRLGKEIAERKLAQRERDDAFEVITGSIQYASRIQRSMLPDESLFTSIFDDHFILWQPRDVVGGDIYWASHWGKGTILILGDCTGHGVPGAFMTLITTGAMERALVETEEGNVSEFLQRVHQMVQVTLSQHGQSSESDDGMELGVCYFAPNGKTMHFAGARFDLFMIENGEMTVVKPTKSGIGYCGIPFDQEYAEHRINITSGQAVYMTSDGLIDQVGGERRRSYGKKRFKELLLSVQDKPMREQKDIIYHALTDFQGDQNRRDDVAVIGFKI